MSVLYKALQKAQSENEQKQGGGTALDAERLAGSGAIRAAGRPGLNWRTGALIAVLVLAGAAGAGLFLFDGEELPPQQARVEPLRITPPPAQQAPLPQPAAPASPTPATTPGAEQSQQIAAAPGSMAGAVAPAAAPTPAPQSAPETAPPAAAAALSPPSATPAAAPESPPAPAQVAGAAPAINTATAPIPLTPKAAAPQVPAPGAQAPMPRQPTEILPDSPARVLSPPISISRADYDFSGVGEAVQVRRVSQQAQDNVGSGYNALVRGDYDMALNFYDRALKQEPRSVMAELGRAAAFHKLGRLDDARASYERVLKNDANNREALTNLTAIMGEKAPAEALDRLIQLERDYPGFSPIKAQIGLLYAKTNSLDNALQYLRKATSLTPEAPLYHYNLALVLDRLGRKDQAIAAYRQFLDASGGRAPQGIVVADIERRMQFLRAN